MNKRVDLMLVQNLDDIHLYDSVIVPFGKALVGDLVEYAGTVGRVVNVVEFIERDSSIIKYAKMVSDVYEDNLTVYSKHFEVKEEETDGESV